MEKHLSEYISTALRDFKTTRFKSPFNFQIYIKRVTWRLRSKNRIKTHVFQVLTYFISPFYTSQINQLSSQENTVFSTKHTSTLFYLFRPHIMPGVSFFWKVLILTFSALEVSFSPQTFPIPFFLFPHCNIYFIHFFNSYIINDCSVVFLEQFIPMVSLGCIDLWDGTLCKTGLY